MASSSGKKNYPSRLYGKGKTPIQRRSMNHNCHLSNLTMVKEAIGEDVWDDIRDSSVGVIIKLHQMDDYIWCAKTVHYFLTNQLAIKKNHEIWSLIDGQPIRFSLYEFAEITGLKSDPFDGQDKWDVDHKEFWGELAVSPELGPSLNELKLVLTRCRDWSFAKRRMVGLLCILSIGIFGISPGSRIPLACAKQVMDPDIFDRYPWGRFAFKSLMDSIKVVTFGAKNTYIIRGCVHVLLIWAYESVPALGKLYGNKNEGQIVPLVSWGGSRRRFEFDDLFAEEKKTYNKVRVRHLIVKPEEEIYPKWIEDKDDKVLDNLIKDIIHDRFGINAWDAVVAKDPVTNMRKRKIHVNQSDEDNGAETYTQKNKKHACAATRTLKRNSKAVALVDEPKFYCPICLWSFTEETSTKCGHIFCNSCIKKAISHQPKCPTCRKNVTAEDLIRVFLPTTGCMLH